MKKIHFITPTLLSYIDLISMGGSEKEGDSSKIGTFCSGLKYSMALALRNDVNMEFNVSDGVDITNYVLGTFVKDCEQTGKNKELINLHIKTNKEDTKRVIETGYSVKMGLNWELWMLLREIYSNMVDEGGYYSEDPNPVITHGTVTTLEFEHGSDFDEIWTNRHLYINEKEPLHVLSSSVQVLSNDEGYLRIYKQNILVYQDKKIPSRFAYNIKFGVIDERRVLSDVYNVEGNICDAILSTSDESYLRKIISSNFSTQENEFLSNRGSYFAVSERIHNIASEIYDEHGEVNTYDWILNKVKELKHCKIGGKVLKTLEDSIWDYSTKVTVNTTPVEGERSFIDILSSHYNFDLDVDVKVAQLSGSKAVADKYLNCIIVAEDFDPIEDFPEFIVEYVDLKMKGNTVRNLGVFITKILKK